MALRKTRRTTPGRELLFYGAVRKGFDESRTGLEAVKSAVEELLQGDPENVRLERFLSRIDRCLEEVHQLHVKAGRVRVQQGVLS